MQRLFIIISVLCLGIAVFFFLRGNLDGAFIVATLGVIAYFLNIRSNFKAAIRENEKNNSEDLEDDDLQKDEN